MQPGHDERLWQEALALLLRLHDHPNDPAAHQGALRWRALSPEHQSVWTEAEEVWRLSGELKPSAGAGSGAARAAGARTSRRRVLAGLAAAAAAGVAGLWGPDIVRRARADFATGAAEIGSFGLPDGSSATLGPESLLRVAFSEARREVELIAGMAYFDVAENGQRPFSATCGLMTVAASATSFELSSEASLLTAASDRGQIAVSVTRPGGAKAETTLDGGDWLSFDESDTTTMTGRRDAEHRAAWRQGLVIAEREPIAAVVAKVARWQRGKVVIGPGLASRRVSGVFDLRDPTAALEAIVAPFDGRVHRLTSWLTVLSTV